MPSVSFPCPCGLDVTRTTRTLPTDGAIEPLVSALDGRRGALFASSYEFPGRYTRWDLGFVDPPLVLEAKGREFTLSALNERGALLLEAFHPSLRHAH